MKRHQWKDLLEGFGFLAILISLIFIGLETRQSTVQTELNTSALQINAYQELMNNISEFNKTVIENKEAAEVIARAYGSDNLEEFQSTSTMFFAFRHGDIAFFMYERGAISEDRLRSSLHILPLHTKAGRRFWHSKKTSFVDSYQSYIDRLLEEGFWD